MNPAHLKGGVFQVKLQRNSKLRMVVVPMVDMITKEVLDVGESRYKPQYPYIPCLCCGMCCMGYRVCLSLAEARRIAEGLGVAWHEFQDRYVTKCWTGADSFYLRQCDGVCVFLKQRGSHRTVCLIHSFRPSACREWTPSLYRRQCQVGLTRHWGLRVSSSGEIQGPEEKLQDFRSFWGSLDGRETDADL